MGLYINGVSYGMDVIVLSSQSEYDGLEVQDDVMYIIPQVTRQPPNAQPSNGGE